MAGLDKRTQGRKEGGKEGKMKGGGEGDLIS